MKLKKSLTSLIVLSGLFLTACFSQPTLVVVTREPRQAGTEVPTFTPLPTDTPFMTLTETPAAAMEATKTATTAAEVAKVTATATAVEAATTTATTTPKQTFALGSTRISAKDQMVEIYIPAGEFTMGSVGPNAKNDNEGRVYPEGPEHQVYLESYWIDQFEVSNRQYALCVQAGDCKPPYLFSSETRVRYYDLPEFGEYPVIWVNWDMARAYCAWAGRRLPTEAEWEKAARGTDGREFPWGNEPVDGQKANFCDVNCPRDYASGVFDDGYGDTSPVGSYPAGASPYGVMDMAGNVWEWTSTIISPYPYDPADGREDPETYAERAWRGGPWSNGTWWLRATVRYRSVPFYWNLNLGFRCSVSE